MSATATEPNGGGAAAPEVVLQAVGLSAGYGNVPVLRDVNLRVGAGQVVGLLGPNGAGKTTLLLTLSGVLPRLAGDILFRGKSTRAPLHKRARDGMSLVTEDRSIFRGLTMAENLRVGSVDVDSVLELFPELSTRVNVKAGLLSGGEQQMLTMARALLREPSVLLVDELSLGLAPLIVKRLLEKVTESVSRRGSGVLLVEQHVRRALQYSDWVYILNRGQVVLEGSAADLASRIGEIERTYLAGGSA